mmetsp:Transcript_11860/g.17672  ORF Transcript_11860/g.17672 Transcript_11860/m.17672 type:complete len:352 (+) Transcript_11860:1580-2635(+)
MFSKKQKISLVAAIFACTALRYHQWLQSPEIGLPRSRCRCKARFSREDGELYNVNQADAIRIFKGNEEMKEYKRVLDRDGAVKIPAFLNAERLQLCRKECEKIVESSMSGVQVGYQLNDLASSSSKEAQVKQFLQFTLQAGLSEELLELVRGDELSGIASAMLSHPGKPVAFHADDIFVKQAGCNERTAWHRDTYRDMSDSPKMVNVWMCLNKLPKEDSLRILKGSHLTARLDLGGDKQNEVARQALGRDWQRELRELLPISSEAIGKFEEDGLVASFALEILEKSLGRERFELIYPVLDWDLEFGDTILFYRQALHSAYGNSMPIDRIALSTRWGETTQRHMNTQRRFEQ